MNTTLDHIIKPAILMVFLCTTLSNLQSDGQILGDTSAMNLIRKGVDDIYGFRFEEAIRTQSEINRRFPEHPVTYLFNGLITYWKNFPLTPSSPERYSFEEDMIKCIEICENDASRRDDAEYLLANLSGRGLLLVFYSDNDLSKDVIPLATHTYKYVRQSFDHTSQCSDLKYFTGLYNYYRDAYPRIYPIYRSVAFLFPPGDSKTGLKELEESAEQSFVLSPESYFILSWIFMNYENDYHKSLSFISILNEKYPSNVLHRAFLIKNHLLLKQYDDAEYLIVSPAGNVSNSFYRAVITILTGILQEKKYNDLNKARENYLAGLKEIEKFGAFGYEYAAYAWFGLSRISDSEGNKNEMRLYRRKAVDLADFKKINFDE